MNTSYDSAIRCGIVLAGGDGTRLRPFVRQLRGNSLPKQYVNFIGTRSMLEHTFHRAEKVIPPGSLFTVVNKNHLNYQEARRQISTRPRGTIVVQPENKDTAPGILLPLVHLHKKYPDSLVAIFPSDHFVREEDLFMLHVGLALRVAERDPSRVILLGVEPNEPEPEYGYILPGEEERIREPLGIRRVHRFVEKPGPAAAKELLLQGALWNTMVTVATSQTLLDLIRCIVPDLYESFMQISAVIGTPDETKFVEKIYGSMKPINFSKVLLEALPLHQRPCLSVFPISGIFWSDWGSSHRVLNVLKKSGYLARLRGVPEQQLFSLWTRA